MGDKKLYSVPFILLLFSPGFRGQGVRAALHCAARCIHAGLGKPAEVGFTMAVALTALAWGRWTSELCFDLLSANSSNCLRRVSKLAGRCSFACGAMSFMGGESLVLSGSSLVLEGYRQLAWMALDLGHSPRQSPTSLPISACPGI
jgi:hypothetical protein